MSAPEPELSAPELEGDVARAPFVIAESALDRATSRDRARLFVYLYGDPADVAQRLREPRVTPSELDLDFAVLVARWGTRDPALIEAVMRGESSPMPRAKWNEKRGPSTWLRKYTIPAALRAVRDEPDPSVRPDQPEAAAPIRARTLREIMQNPDARKPPQPVVPRLAWRGRLTVYAAPDKAGKSTLVAAGVAAMTRGDRFLGEPTARGTCLWAMLEEHVNDFAIRATGFGTDPDALRVVEHPTDPVAAIRAEAERLRPAVVVVDTLIEYAGARVTEGGSSAQWTVVMNGLQRLARELEIAVVVLHHGRKSDGVARDSTEITARADVVIEQAAKHQGGVARLAVRGRWALADFAVRLAGGRYELVDGAGALAAAEDDLDRRAWEWIGANPDAGATAVRAGVGGNAERVDQAVARLLEGRARRIENRGTAARPRYRQAPPLPEM